MADLDMTDAGPDEPSDERTFEPQLNAQERRILALYDRLEVLRFETAWLQEQAITFSNPVPYEPDAAELEQAQQDYLEAKAQHSVRAEIIQNVLIARPILNAVHAGMDAEIAEYDLQPRIEQRDEASLRLCRAENDIQALREQLLRAEVEHIRLAKQNRTLAATMMQLAEAAKTGKDDVTDEAARRKLDNLEAKIVRDQHRWRIIKGTLGATIVGSGVDWAGDPALVELVFDEELDDDSARRTDPWLQAEAPYERGCQD